MFPYVALMLGCHFTKEDVVKLQKGLRFKFLESHNLEGDRCIFDMLLLIT